MHDAGCGDKYAVAGKASIPGLTKRELFAAMALQGLLSATPELKPEITYLDVVIEARKWADTLILALSTEPTS